MNPFSLICLLSSTSIDPISLEELKRALVAYFALLCYTGTSHVSLQYLLPLSSGSNVHASTTTTRIATARLILPFLRLLHPRTLLFLPPMLVFLPGHALGSLAGRYLAVAPAAPSTPAELAEMKKRKERVEMADEEESKAQYKAVIGGVGVSFGCYLAGRLVLGSLVRLGLRSRAPAFGSAFSSALLTSLGLGGWESSRWVQGISSALDGTAEWAHIIGAFLGASEGGARSSMMRGLGKLGVIYATGWVVVKWHNLLIGCKSFHQPSSFLCTLFIHHALDREQNHAQSHAHFLPPAPFHCFPPCTSVGTGAIPCATAASGEPLHQAQRNQLSSTAKG